MSAHPATWLTSFAAFLRLYPEFQAPSWAAWRSLGATFHGEAPEDPAFVRHATGRAVLPSAAIRAAFVGAGRGTGKSRFCGGVQPVYFAVGREYRPVPGELIYVTVHAPTKRQSAITFRYIVGLLKAVPSFASMIVRETTDTVELTNSVVIEVGTGDYRTVRGRSIALAVVEEGAFLPTEESATPDTELLRALRPALARVPGSLLLFVSSPYAQRGELFKAFREHYGNDSSPVLYVKATTRELNPTFDEQAITEAFTDDPLSAAAEYGAEFRRDVETFLSREAIEAVVVPGRIELPPVSSRAYRAFFDAAGGSGTDSQTLGIAHEETRDGHAIAVLDLVREVRPPFSPETVIEEFAALLKAYGLSRVTSDRYAADWPREQWRKRGIECVTSEKTASDLFREALSLVNSGRVELLDEPRLVTQLAALERRTGRGGKDTVSHPPGGHDDVAVAAVGALVHAARPHAPLRFWGGSLADSSDLIDQLVEELMQESDAESVEHEQGA